MVQTNDLIGTAFTILATSLALAAITENARLKGRVRDLEVSVRSAQQQILALTDALGSVHGTHASTPFFSGAGGNGTQNVFYAGTDTQIKLDRSILGPRAPGEMDQYDTVFPSVLAFGTAVVRGSGRLILDGDASDIIMKIDNTYFSVRELFGFGKSLTFGQAQPPPPPPDAALLRDLCTDTDVLTPTDSGATNCAYRRNWGVDACFRDKDSIPICVCGGGWQSLSRVIRVRHFLPHISNVVPSFSDTLFEDFTNVFFSHSAFCCAPGPLNATCTNLPLNPPGDSPKADWLDTSLRCDNSEDRLCDQKDRSDYLGFYEPCVTNSTPSCLIAAREKVNRHGWTATRDYRFDDGQWYALQLTTQVERACEGLRLSLVHTHAFINSFPAAFECNRGTRLWFEVAPTPNNESAQRGSQYYMLSHEPSHSGWYCLSGQASADVVSEHVGDANTLASDQLLWLPYPQLEDSCQKLYLGQREPFDLKMDPDAKIGIYTDKENNFARFKANVEFTIVPYD